MTVFVIAIRKMNYINTGSFEPERPRFFRFPWPIPETRPIPRSSNFLQSSLAQLCETSDARSRAFPIIKYTTGLNEKPSNLIRSNANPAFLYLHHISIAFLLLIGKKVVELFHYHFYSFLYSSLFRSGIFFCLPS